MALDLSALEEKPKLEAVSGKPLDLRLSDIEEDPNQPRKEFSDESMQEMTESIKARGVKTPVSVRPHPAKPGKWILNYGARRYRGSLAAGKKTIPAFIDEAHDDYDQVIENIQREDLKPMELALFIKKRIDAGDKKGSIAKHLGKDGAMIAQHLALIDPPACIEEVYSTGKCTSANTLYDLRRLFEKHPDQVEIWCSNGTEITRRTVAVLAEELKNSNKKSAPGNSVTSSEEFDHGQISHGDKNIVESNSSSDKEDAGSSTKSIKDPGAVTGKDEKFAPTQISDKHDGDVRSDTTQDKGTQTAINSGEEKFDHDQIGKDRGELTSWPKGHAVSDPHRMNKPLLLVDYDGRSAAVLLNRRPSSTGLLYIRFEDGGGDIEIDATLCKIQMLTEIGKTT